MDNEKPMTATEVIENQNRAFSCKSECSGSAQAFVDVGFELLDKIADGKVCSERTCLRCRIADILFEVQAKYLKEPYARNNECSDEML